MGIKTLKPQTRSTIITYAIVVGAFVLVTILDGLGLISHSLSGQLVPICAYVSLAVSLNLVVGVSGELSLGHAGFMSVGAFTGVVVAGCMARAGVENGILLFVGAAVVGAIAAGVIGFLVGIPVMRLRGDYLAIVTLAFGEIIKNLLNIFYVGVDDAGLHFSLTDSASLGMSKGTILINGPKGAVGIEKVSTFFIGIVLVLVTVAVVLNLMHSRDGRAIMAVRDNRIAAESIGINTTSALRHELLHHRAVAVRLQPVDSDPRVRGAWRYGQHLRLDHLGRLPDGAARGAASHQQLPHAALRDRPHPRDGRAAYQDLPAYRRRAAPSFPQG